MMKIGIFGGSYNPPHKMHLNIALELLNKKYVDKIIFIPTGSKYKYKTNLVSDEKRLEMLRIMIKNDKRFEISDYELKDEVVYTCETLAHFKETYPNDEIFFICGADNLSYMDEWKNGLEILNNYKILVIDRKTNDLESILNKFNEYRKNIIVAPIEARDVSSTEIRLLVKNKKYEELEKYLDKDITQYIKENKLYENGE